MPPAYPVPARCLNSVFRQHRFGAVAIAAVEPLRQIDCAQRLRIAVLVDEIHRQVRKPSTLFVGDNLHFRKARLDRVVDELVAIRVERVEAVLVADLDVLEPERRGMPRLRAQRAPTCW